MWKVTNNVNKIILDKFNDSIIEPFFRVLINLSYKINEGQISKPMFNSETWRLSKYYNFSNSNLYDYVFNKKFKKVPMKVVMNEILINLSLSNIVDYYKIYKTQNNNINKLIYSVKIVVVDKNLSKIFNNYFYECMFNDEYIWTTIYGQVYSRSTFHDNFKKENNEMVMCPYCDLDTTLSTANNNVEHMLPKSKFPFLSMNGNNLISSCFACNGPYEGKGIIVKSPIIFPYIIEIGNYLDFKIKQKDETIEIGINKKIVTDTNLEKQLNNYLDLLKLKKRYSSNKVFKLVNTKINVLFDCISGFEYNDDSFEQYISQYCLGNSKKEPLMFSIKNNIKNLKDYRSYFGK